MGVVAAASLLLTASAQARGRADLVEVRFANPPARLAAGRSFRIVDAVANRGVAAAPRSVTRYYLRFGATALPAGRRRVPSLRRHGSARPRVRLVVPPAARAGRYALVACVDATRRVRERDERNNCRAARRRVGVPGPGGAIPGSPAGSTSPAATDGDRDGFPDAVECAPRSAAIHPGAVDAPDLAFVDANCDGIDGAATAAGDTEGALALNISATTTVQLAPDAPAAFGASSYGLRGLNSSGLRLERVSVLGASGAAGAPGAGGADGLRAATAALAAVRPASGEAGAAPSCTSEATAGTAAPECTERAASRGGC